MVKPEKAYLPLRVYLCLRTLVVVLVTLYVPESLNGKLVAQSGTAGFIVIALQWALASVGLLDVLINDLMPEKYSLRGTREHRHYGYIAMALCNCAFLLVMMKNDNITLLLLSYVADAAAAVWVAVGTVLRNQKTKRYPFVDRRKAA